MLTNKQRLGAWIYSQHTQRLRQSCETHIYKQVNDKLKIRLWNQLYYTIISSPVYDQLEAQIFEDHE
jgi:hypothetical protein